MPVLICTPPVLIHLYHLPVLICTPPTLPTHTPHACLCSFIPPSSYTPCPLRLNTSPGYPWLATGGPRSMLQQLWSYGGWKGYVLAADVRFLGRQIWALEPQCLIPLGGQNSFMVRNVWSFRRTDRLEIFLTWLLWHLLYIVIYWQ